MYLKKWYAVEGLDLNPIQLKQARKKLPEARFHRGDMCSFDLGTKYDIVTCLFSAIGYAKTKKGASARPWNECPNVKSQKAC